MQRRQFLVGFGATLGSLALSACGSSRAQPSASPGGAASPVPPAATSAPTLPPATAAVPSPTRPLPAATTAPAATPRAAPTVAAAPTGAAVPTSAPTAAGANLGYPDRDILVDVEWLAGRIGTSSPRLIELSAADEYARGHLPGATNLQWQDLNLTDSAAATISTWRGAMEQKLGALGITPADQVVVYDDGSLWAARVWWVLGQLGQRTAQVLNGGKPSWQAAGKPLSADPAQPTVAQYHGTPDPTSLITADELRATLGSPNLALVDARTPDEYHGRDNSGARRSGHIPGAVNIPYTTSAKADPPRTFLPPQELLALYAAQGVTPDKDVVAYCSTGVRSTVTSFTLVLLAFPRVRLYSPSWAEWGNRDDLPVET